MPGKAGGAANRKDGAFLATIVAPPDTDRLSLAREAQRRLEPHATEELRELWRAYLTLGHRVLGRLLLGQSPERALRIDNGNN